MTRGPRSTPWFAPLAALLVATPAAIAQSYPAKTVRMIVPSAAGGSVDTMTRLLSQKLSESMQQQFVVENRAGSGGVIGTEVVARAAPDGYTLLAAYASHVINPGLYTRLPYDTVRDFAPITQIAQQPLIVVLHPSLPVRSVKDLIDLARRRPGDLLFASAGSGSGGHLATEIFNSMAGTKMTHVPYKGAAPALTDVIAGHTQIMFVTLVSALPQVRGGRLRAIAVTGGKRSAAAPDLPTIAEGGLPGYEAVVHYFLLAPAGTPREVIGRLNSESAKALNAPDLIERLARDGAEPLFRTPEDTAGYIRAEIEKWGSATRRSGARAE
jgi:tripartite-type tricarboxylate transporter receptor subunit TctC